MAKTYAVLDGGGVKGAALIGALAGAAEAQVRFDGYAGSSAGAIVAALSAAGWTPNELHNLMVEEVSFADLLDDAGKRSRDIQRFLRPQEEAEVGILLRPWRLGTRPIRFVNGVRRAWRLRRRLRASRGYGLYEGEVLREFIDRRLGEKLDDLKNVTFEQLHQRGIDLRIVASNIDDQSPAEFSTADRRCDRVSVADAVMASAAFPLFFRYRTLNNARHTDGGLVSNLPVFVLHKEARDGHAVIAFDLVTPAKEHRRDNLPAFIFDLIDTTTNAPDRIAARTVRGLETVTIEVPGEVETLDFDLSRDDRQRLYDAGLEAARTQLAGRSRHRRVVPIIREAIAENFDILLDNVLSKVAITLERQTRAEDVRVAVALMERGTELLTIQYRSNMDGPENGDRDLRLSVGTGASGRAFEKCKPVLVDLLATAHNPHDWGLSEDQQRLVRADRQSMLSVPIFDPDDPYKGLSVAEPIGVLSVDSRTALPETGWLPDPNNDPGDAIRILVDFAEAIGTLLTRKL